MDFTVNIAHKVRVVFVKVWMRVNVLIGVFLIGNLFEIVNI